MKSLNCLQSIRNNYYDLFFEIKRDNVSVLLLGGIIVNDLTLNNQLFHTINHCVFGIF